jgi:fructose-1,6-bisphosphatase/inositol monophosphatase family enzyme
VTTFDLARDLDRAVDVIRRALDSAGRAALAHFRTGVRVETKPDRSPVTAADREAEAAILRDLLGVWPDASVLAEESGERVGDPELRWIVDPIDGTRGFTRGASFWGPIIALEDHGEIVAGGVSLPALGEVYLAARGQGCFTGDGTPVRVSGVRDWNSATLSLGEMRFLKSSRWGTAVRPESATQVCRNAAPPARDRAKTRPRIARISLETTATAGRKAAASCVTNQTLRIGIDSRTSDRSSFGSLSPQPTGIGTRP